MKALTLWQPWATLVMLGAKEYETRSWIPSARQLLVGDEFVIHAAKRWTKGQQALLDEPEFDEALRDYFLSGEELPLGAGLGVVRVVGFGIADSLQISRAERAFGDFGPDRWAWQLEVVRGFEWPVPARGYQGLWTWTGPESAVMPLIP